MASLALIGAVVALLDCGGSSDSAMLVGGAGGGGYDAGGAGDSAEAASCPLGEYTCDGTIARKCGSDDAPVDCAANGRVCAVGLGCVVCLPGARSCDPATNRARYCLPDGSSEVAFDCDPVQGMQCAESGCSGSCSPEQLGRTHVGCDFFPTITANAVWGDWFRFGILVTNAGAAGANVTLTRGGDQLLQGVVEKDGFAVFELDWIDQLKGPSADEKGTVTAPVAGVFVESGAYRLRTDQPVAVLQFNTLVSENEQGVQTGCPDPFQLGRCLSLSNDASLLVPVTSMMTSHALMGWHAWHIDAQTSMPDLVAITAVHDDTEVTLTAGKATTSASLPGGVPGLQPGQQQSFTLGKRGDVLQLFTEGSSSKNQWAGSRIEASRPVQVLTGAPCVDVPGDTIACDHLEELVPPLDTLGREYIVAAPLTPKGARRHIVRILGIKDATALTFEPHDVHSAVTVGAQETIEIDTERDFQVSSTGPIAVAQFLMGHGGGEAPTGGVGVGDGDPSQTTCVPQVRYLKEYVFATPPGFASQRLNLAAPTGAVVKLNGVVVDPKSFAPVGGSGFGVARVELQSGVRYQVRADHPIGAQLYGYGPFTSFKAPLGMDLRPIPSN